MLGTLWLACSSTLQCRANVAQGSHGSATRNCVQQAAVKCNANQSTYTNSPGLNMPNTSFVKLVAY